MAVRRVLYLLTWLGSLVFFYFHRLWFSWFLVIFLLVLPFFSLLVSLPAMVTARLELMPAAPMPVGTGKTLRLRCKALLPVGAWTCKVRVERPLTGDSWVMKHGGILPSAHCGQLVCTVFKARVCDYLGLFSLPIPNPEPMTVTVRPVPTTMTSLPAMRRQTMAWRPKRGGGYSENHELRPYRPGDNIRDIHWKLSAKTGQLILRESMEPVRGRVLLRLDLRGTPEELNRMLGRLLWLGGHLLDKDIHFEIHALTGAGFECWAVSGATGLLQALDDLLSRQQAAEGTVRQRAERASWQYEIGGGADEP